MTENSMIGDAQPAEAKTSTRNIKITITNKSVAISEAIKQGQDQLEMIEEFERLATVAAEKMLAKHREHGGLEMSPREAVLLSYSYGDAPRLSIEPSPKAIRSLGGVDDKSSPLKAAEAAFRLAGKRLPSFTKLGLMIMGRLASADSKKQVCAGIQNGIIEPMAREKLMSALAIAVIEEHGRHFAKMARP